MAELCIHLHFLFFFIFIFFSSSSVHSRTLQQMPKTTTFDVSASLQKSIDVLSYNPETTKQQEFPTQTNSSFTVRLHSRDTLFKSPFKTYRELALSRLQHDSDRLSFIHNKLYKSRGGSNASELSSQDLESPLTSGGSQNLGAYFARIGFGTPPQQLYTTIDTGSDVIWIQCAPCAPPNCYEQVDPLFDPSKSSSYKQLSCDSQPCKNLELRDCYADTNTCVYGASYGDGNTRTVGDFSTETLTFGTSAVNDIAIGCGRDNRGKFRAQAGIFGLGRGPVSFPSQLKTSSFSYCLVDIDSAAASTLDLGPVAIPTDAVTTALLVNNKNPTFYYVGLTGISVGGQMLPIPASAFEIGSDGEGGVVVDSGTTVSGFPPEVYNALRDEFVKGTAGLPPSEGIDGFDTCYDLTSQTKVSVPTIALHFSDTSLNIPGQGHLYHVGANIFCLAFQGSPGVSIIGNLQQQGTQVTYDVGKSLIGFSQNKC